MLRIGIERRMRRQFGTGRGEADLGAQIRVLGGHLGDQRLEIGEDFLQRFARNAATVEIDSADVRNHRTRRLVARRAPQRSHRLAVGIAQDRRDVERSRPEQRMLAGAGARDEFALDRIDDVRRLVDRTDAGMRLARMASAAFDVDTVVVESLVRRDGAERARLRHHDHVGARPVLDHVQRAKARGILLRDDAGEDQVAREREAGSLQRDHRRELSGDAALHVDGAAAGQLAVCHLGRERRRHLARRHGVDMAVEHQRRAAAFSLQCADDVAAPVSHVLQCRRNALARQQRLDVPGAGRLVPG